MGVGRGEETGGIGEGDVTESMFNVCFILHVIYVFYVLILLLFICYLFAFTIVK